MLEENYAFENNKGSLDFSCDVIEMSFDKAEQRKGTFQIQNMAETPMEGYILSNDMRMQCLTPIFRGESAEITYCFDSTGMEPGDEVKGEFQIISNKGEYTLGIELAYADTFTFRESFVKLQSLMEDMRGIHIDGAQIYGPVPGTTGDEIPPASSESSSSEPESRPESEPSVDPSIGSESQPENPVSSAIAVTRSSTSASGVSVPTSKSTPTAIPATVAYSGRKLFSTSTVITPRSPNPQTCVILTIRIYFSRNRKALPFPARA